MGRLAGLVKTDRAAIDRMYTEVLGSPTCPHGVYLPDAYCESCGEAVKRECQDLAEAVRWIFHADCGQEQ